VRVGSREVGRQACRESAGGRWQEVRPYAAGRCRKREAVQAGVACYAGSDIYAIIYMVLPGIYGIKRESHMHRERGEQ